MKKDKVICTNAKACSQRSMAGCIHVVPHDRQNLYEGLPDETAVCTIWDECLMPYPTKKVRCTKVKE